MRWKHLIVTHLYALAAFGNTIAIFAVVKDAWKEHYLEKPIHWFLLAAIYVGCLLIVFELRKGPYHGH